MPIWLDWTLAILVVVILIITGELWLRKELRDKNRNQNK